MKTWKLVSGILSIVMFVFVAFQSCAAGVADALVESDQFGGSAGMLVAVLMLAGGIVSIVVRNSKRKGGSIALVILFGLAAVTGFAGAGNYFKDLNIWAGWCTICAVLALISIFTGKKKPAGEEGSAE